MPNWVGFFVIFRLSGSKKSPAAHPIHSSRMALFFGLSSWLGLTLLRHDIVAAAGLIVAIVLIYRHYRAID